MASGGIQELWCVSRLYWHQGHIDGSWTRISSPVGALSNTRVSEYSLSPFHPYLITGDHFCSLLTHSSLRNARLSCDASLRSASDREESQLKGSDLRIRFFSMLTWCSALYTIVYPSEVPLLQPKALELRVLPRARRRCVTVCLSPGRVGQRNKMITAKLIY